MLLETLSKIMLPSVEKTQLILFHTPVFSLKIIKLRVSITEVNTLKQHLPSTRVEKLTCLIKVPMLLNMKSFGMKSIMMTKEKK